MKAYISLFSSGGVGCYGVKEEGYECIATSELNPKRIEIQKNNNKCKYEEGYIAGDITQEETKKRLFSVIKNFKEKEKIESIDLLIATPPCQGMSVANHKKNDELKRNSLIVESLIITQKIKPNYFVFENVRAFLKSVCTDIDNKNKTIEEAIHTHLSKDYVIASKIINFKDYGSYSSRTRTLVIGVKKSLKLSPLLLFPDKVESKVLKEVIGDMKSLKEMGSIDKKDIYHNFKSYKPHMREWIKGIKEGESAFDNKLDKNKPHQIKDGILVININKNGDKYKRQLWDKVAPCIHTRNDILASQNTIHPIDDRVFSIRELMKLMSIPNSFNWSSIKESELNKLPLVEKVKYLKLHELNIRRCIGEAVPTIIFSQIARKIKLLQS